MEINGYSCSIKYRISRRFVVIGNLESSHLSGIWNFLPLPENSLEIMANGKRWITKATVAILISSFAAFLNIYLFSKCLCSACFVVSEARDNYKGNKISTVTHPRDVYIIFSVQLSV